jgi:hypothetical protein
MIQGARATHCKITESCLIGFVFAPSVRQLCRLEVVCRAWREALHDGDLGAELWRDINFSPLQARVQRDTYDPHNKRGWADTTPAAMFWFRI